MMSDRGQYERLKHRWIRCNDCTLRRGCNKVVFGSGNIDARLMLVGEAPGHDEDLEGAPFVGRAAKEILNPTLKTLGIPRHELYITNLVACRPPDNRVPMYDEIDQCRPRLEGLLWVINPQSILILGGTALMALTGEQGITRRRGKRHEVAWSWKSESYVTPALATYHPAGLLPGRIRDQGDLVKFKADLAAAWEMANGRTDQIT